MIARPIRTALVSAACLLRATTAVAQPQPQTQPSLGPVSLPKEWQDRFWGTPQAQAMLKLSPKELTDLVPVQAGLRFCPCPSCDAGERTDPLAWSIEKPKVVRCRKCQGEFPNASFPAPNPSDKKVPVEKVEVLPAVWHTYPYHDIDDDKADYFDERAYLEAKRDYEARAFLAKAALYCAVRWDDQASPVRDPKLASIAAALILRFAQVYPGYAMHNDRPGASKLLLPAKVPPPYRHSYQTGKWDWNGSLETPMNLVLAYSLVRDKADWAEAGKLLDCPDPKRTIEEDLFLASAELSALHPDDCTEDSLAVYRGMLSVGRLLGRKDLVIEARSRLAEFARRGFYYDGFWRGADVLSHRRVLGMLEGWIDGLLAEPDGRPVVGVDVPMLDLARSAAAAVASRPPDPEILQASWPVETSLETDHRPMLLGGAGLALLTVGVPGKSLDVEIRGRDSLVDRRCQRLAFRLSLDGVPLLDDLDEHPATADGWDLATASHNTVVVNGLNQRETAQAARTPSASSDFLYFATDPDFQVVTVSDRHAYPISTRRYRQTFLVSRWGRRRYALSIFEVDGGVQHDQIFHTAYGRKEHWRPNMAATPVAGSLLPPSIEFLPSARPEEGRWFVQAYGEFRPRLRTEASGPCRVDLDRGDGSTPALRLHLLGDSPSSIVTAESPDGPPTPHAPATPGATRSDLIVRRRAEAGAQLTSTFVSLFEPAEPGLAPLDRVGRVDSVGDAVVVVVESPEGTEHFIFNRKPGTRLQVQLASGRYVTTDGLAVRVREDEIVLSGGTYAEANGSLASQPSVRGTIAAAERAPGDHGRGWFLTSDKLPEGLAAAGRTLFVEHGDGSVKAWTLDSVEPTAAGSRLWVREEPGFTIDPATGDAAYYQFPLNTAPGPHRFRLAQTTRVRPTARKVAASPAIGRPRTSSN